MSKLLSVFPPRFIEVSGREAHRLWQNEMMALLLPPTVFLTMTVNDVLALRWPSTAWRHLAGMLIVLFLLVPLMWAWQRVVPQGGLRFWQWIALFLGYATAATAVKALLHALA